MISNKCKYAIKAMFYIARNNGLTHVSNSVDISHSENIPKKFLESILGDLRKARILKSVRGKNGGYALNRDLDEITISEIIRVVDGPIALLPCVSLNFYSSCSDCDKTECPLNKVFTDVRDSSLRILDSSISNYID